MFKLMFREAVTTFVKMFVVCIYVPLSLKILIIDTDVDMILGLPMVALSIYGLWTVLQLLSGYWAARSSGGEVPALKGARR